MKVAGIAGVALALTVYGGLSAAQPPRQARPQQPAPAQDTTVTGVTVTLAPVPNVGDGAPMLTVTEIEEIRTKSERQARDSRGSVQDCGGNANQIDPALALVPSATTLYAQEYQAANRVTDTGQRAADASAAATKARLDFVRGNASQQQVDQTELVRQAAVNQFNQARVALIDARAMTQDFFTLTSMLPQGETVTWGELQAKSVQRMKTHGLEGAPLSINYADLKLTNVRALQFTDRGGPFMRVTGEISNPRDRAIPIPPLAIAAVDHAGFSLKTQTTNPPRSGRIPAHGSMKFTYDFRPRPPLARTVVVTFADWAMQNNDMGAAFNCRPQPSQTP